MQLSLNGVILGQGLDLEGYLDLAARTGFSGVDTIGNAKQIADEKGVNAVLDLFEKYNVRPSSWGIPVDWKGSDDSFEQSLAEFPKHLEFGVAIGCPRACTWILPAIDGDPADFRRQSVERWRKAGQVAEDYGVRLGLEWVGPATLREGKNDFIYTMDQLLDMEDEAGVDSLGLLVDSFHWYTAGHTVADLEAVPVEKIVHVHLNDAPDKPREQQIDSQRLLPGEGIIDLTGFLGALKKIGYTDYMGIETFSEELKALPVEESAARAAAAGRSVLAGV